MKTHLVATNAILAAASAPDADLVKIQAFFVIVFGILVLASVLFVVFQIATCIWVVRDVRNRGMDSGILWMVLVLFTGGIGLLIYFCSRTPGQLILCDNCLGKHLEYSKQCPHCGNCPIMTVAEA